jgi:hypothetical protein
MDTPRETFDKEHFVQAHPLKSFEGELVMLYPHSATTIVLICPELGLYQVKKFTLNLASEDDAEMIALTTQPLWAQTSHLIAHSQK